MISVAMASYNGEKYIKRQISSILVNLGQEDELVISDDGSTDRTLEIVNLFCDDRIRVVGGPQKGLVKNFENAIKECKGEYIFLCDQDDYWYDGKVEKIIKCFREKECLLVEHDAQVVDENGTVIYPSFFQYRRVRRGVVKNWLRNTYHGCLIAFDARIKPYIFPFPESGCYHDQWIGIIADYLGEVEFYDKKLMDYVRHGENESSFKHLPFIKQALYRIKLLCFLIKQQRTIKRVMRGKNVEKNNREQD